MHLILTGATGLIGASVLDNMLAQEGISRISILSRRPVEMAEGHDKAKVIIHKDYKTYDKALLEELKDAQGCVWAQGVSQNDVTKEYVLLKQHHPRKLTQTAASTSKLRTTTPSRPPKPSPPSTLTHPSHSSTSPAKAPHTPPALYNLAKATPNLKVYNIRPGGVDWTNHPEIHAFIPHQQWWKKAMIPGLNVVYKGLMTPTKPMGRIMTELAMKRGEELEGSGIEMEGTLVTNEGFRRMAGL
jgi:hypothetical protein